MNSLSQAFAQILKGLKTLPPSRLFSVLTAAGIILLSIVILVWYVNKTEYRVLFSNLSTEDAGGIVALLDKEKISYRLSPAGSSVFVPSDKVSEIRLKLAASGLPRDGEVGFEIFDGKNFGVTAFVQHLNYQRALQGELSRTIKGLDEIQQCRVHIVMPKRSLFVEEQKKPTASIIVKLRSGRRLQESQIDGITYLVASSVEGLMPSDVMVVDNGGNILSKTEGGSEAARMTASQTERQRNIEGELSSSIQSMLEKVVGEGKAVVRVSAALDFRMVEKTEELYDPEEPVIRSMQRQTEKAGGAGAGGESTVSPTGTESVANEAVKREKTEEVINYEINRVVNKTVMPVGEIKRLSIAVLVDGIYARDKEGMLTYQPRSKKEVAVLEDVVKKASGFDSERGDQVIVTNIPFERAVLETLPVEEESWLDKMAVFFPLIKYLILLVALILIVMFIIRPVVRMLVAKGVEAEVPRRELLPGSPEEVGGERPPLGIAEPGIGKFAEAEVVRQMAVTNPKGVAELLRDWM